MTTEKKPASAAELQKRIEKLEKEMKSVYSKAYAKGYTKTHDNIMKSHNMMYERMVNAQNKLAAIEKEKEQALAQQNRSMQFQINERENKIRKLEKEIKVAEDNFSELSGICGRYKEKLADIEKEVEGSKEQIIKDSLVELLRERYGDLNLNMVPKDERSLRGDERELIDKIFCKLLDIIRNGGEVPMNRNNVRIKPNNESGLYIDGKRQDVVAAKDYIIVLRRKA